VESLSSLQTQLIHLKETFADELNNQSDMLTDLTNNLQVNNRVVPVPVPVYS
jgi:hypothetical protein